jgi:hypothetical protein
VKEIARPCIGLGHGRKSFVTRARPTIMMEGSNKSILLDEKVWEEAADTLCHVRAPFSIGNMKRKFVSDKIYEEHISKIRHITILT